MAIEQMAINTFISESTNDETVAPLHYARLPGPPPAPPLRQGSTKVLRPVRSHRAIRLIIYGYYNYSYPLAI